MVIMRSISVAVLCAAIPAVSLAQAPAAKPTIPQVCTNCHKAEPNALQGIYENVAFKSQAIQLKIDANTEIVKFDPKTLKVRYEGATKDAESTTSRRTGKRASTTSRRTARSSPRRSRSRARRRSPRRSSRTTRKSSDWSRRARRAATC